jgi:hypothetical protein
MGLDAERLPAWVNWQRRPFPDANLLLLRGRQPALVDSGVVGHAKQTAAWIRTPGHTPATCDRQGRCEAAARRERDPKVAVVQAAADLVESPTRLSKE